jgi:hypothetical protein
MEFDWDADNLQHSQDMASIQKKPRRLLHEALKKERSA